MTIQGCTVADITVNNKNDATNMAVGDFVGGVGKSVTAKAGGKYSVAVIVDGNSTIPDGRIGEELTLDYSTDSTSGTVARRSASRRFRG